MRTSTGLATVDVPVIPANGIKENDYRVVRLGDSLYLREDKVAGNMYDADVLINFAHGKGHGSCVYRGAIENFAIGATTPDVRSQEHDLKKP